ncbi:MAG: AraC family transcriptional regulator [Clostridia bacterium]|nr:AraC family transcriptional regulator [Clostridia bacterium]
MKSCDTFFKPICPFEVKTKYIEVDSTSPENVHDSHIHEECEIYINLSGDVSFVVDDSIYPVVPGSIIITRPFEYHHCVYHSNKLHKHFWILFSAVGNEYLFDAFYNRRVGENNLLMLTPDKTKELISICSEMAEDSGSDLKKYCRFFKLMSLLHDADTPNYSTSAYPDDVVDAIKYINDNLSNRLTVAEISQKVNVSINTLERHFMRVLNVSPVAYIRKKRLSNAVKLLSEGRTVTEASEKSGFSDYSGFIALFKKTYGRTPLAYKKSRDSH